MTQFRYPKVAALRSTQSPWMSKMEAAHYLRVHARTVDKWCRDGLLTKHTIPPFQTVRFLRSEVESIIQAKSDPA